jgi:hypothetical protein
VGVACPVQAEDRIPVKTADDLPRHTYTLAGKASDVLRSEEQFGALARQVRTDVEADFAKYDIQDTATLQRLHGVLLSLDLLEGRCGEAAKRIERLRELENKEAQKLTAGLTAEAYLAATHQGGSMSKRREVFGRCLLERLHGLPWEIVRDEIEAQKAKAEIYSENLLMGLVQSRLDPIVEKAEGQVSCEVAHGIIGIKAVLDIQLPYRSNTIEVYQAVIDEHRLERKQNIWATRSVTLLPRDGGTPIVAAVWCSGVDTGLFRNRLYVNPNEQIDGEDNDRNGFVDDVHGIAFDLDDNAVPELLLPLDELEADLGTVTRYIKGFVDLEAAIDSPEASVLRRVLSELKPEEVEPFVHDLRLVGAYSHGTHVAGIVAEGNPFVRLLPVRLTYDTRMIPRAPSIEQAEKGAKAIAATVEYLQRSGVRVVNISWGMNRRMIESALEANGVGETVEERAALARRIFSIHRDALYSAISGAPEILFVVAAGSADSDLEFAEMIPAGFELPNLLVVGAVDQAGEPTGFTSFGKTVRVYANGSDVESYIPGGKRLKLSGTPMASPQVVNLAAKILALDPSLTPVQVIELIEKGADRVEGPPPRLLINPKKTIELLKKSPS